MTRELLAHAGYDPNETYDLTPEDACGRAVLDVVKAHGGLPSDNATIRSVIDMANFDLTRAGMDPTADLQTVQRAISTIKKSHITD